MARFLEFEGNLADDPKLRNFDDGNAAATFRLIDNPQHTDRESGEIIKGEPVAMSCNVRGDLARNIAKSARKGDRLLVSGTLKARSWDDEQTGQRRTTEFLQVDSAGLSLRFTSRPKGGASDS